MVARGVAVPSFSGIAPAACQRARRPQTATRSQRDSRAEPRPDWTSPAAEPSSAASRRALLAGLLVAGPVAAAARAAEAADAAAGPDLTITDQLRLDVGLCPEGVRTNRTLGDKTVLCTEPQPLGHIVIGLYGRQAPGTVALIKAVAQAGAFDGTTFGKVLQGQYVVAGRQGSHRMGQVEVPAGLPSNPDMLSPGAFSLRHRRPGTVSLNLSRNEDEEYLRQDVDYRPVSFLITTGPGPAPDLDEENIVFGTVLEGLDTVGAITSVPTFQPSDNMRYFNTFASVLGDDRSGKARAIWGKPIKAVVITRAAIVAAV